MQLSREFRPPVAPTIRICAWPEDVALIVDSVRKNISELSGQCEIFAASLALRQFSEQQDEALRVAEKDNPAFLQGDTLWRQWTFVAARAAGMAARNYVFALQSLQALPGTVSEWNGLIDVDRIKAARSEFNAAFPGIERVRHAIAHPEHHSNPAKEWHTTQDLVVEGQKSLRIARLL